MKIKERGITLIALVITIIILLILAGVTIAMLTGENGILNQAQTAKKDTIIGQEKEQIAIAWNSLVLNKTTGEIDNIDEDNFENELNNSGNNTKVDYVDNDSNKDFSVTFKDTTHEYIVDKNGNIRLKGNKVIEEIEYAKIPNMTSDNEPSGTVNASGVRAGRQAWWAFDGTVINPSTGDGYWYCDYDGVNDTWLSYTWDNKVKIENIMFCLLENARGLTVQYLEEENWINIQEYENISSGNQTIKLNNSIETTSIRFLVKGNGAIGNVKVNETIKENQIPIMTSNTTPTGEVNASGVKAGRQAWWAFDGTLPDAWTGTGYWYCDYDGVNDTWLSYTWDKETTINYISFYSLTGSTVKLQYLKNNEWIDIESYSTTSHSPYNMFHFYEKGFDSSIKTTSIRFVANGDGAIGFVKVY